MTERQRAYRGNELVTVLEGKIGKRGTVKIRNGLGFVESVPGKELAPVDEHDKKAKLKFAEPE